MASEYNMIMAILICLEIAKYVLKKEQIKGMSPSSKSINLQPQTVFQESPSSITSTMSMALEIPYLLNAFTIVFFGSSIHAARIYWHMVGRSVFFLVRLGCSCVIQHPLILFSLKVAGANLD